MTDRLPRQEKPVGGVLSFISERSTVMTIIEKDGKLTIALEGRIDTGNAAQTEKEIFDAVGGRKDDTVASGNKVFDFSTLSYYSSVSEQTTSMHITDIGY